MTSLTSNLFKNLTDNNTTRIYIFGSFGYGALHALYNMDHSIQWYTSFNSYMDSFFSCFIQSTMNALYFPISGPLYLRYLLLKPLKPPVLNKTDLDDMTTEA
jgi:hypothetical protein